MKFKALIAALVALIEPLLNLFAKRQPSGLLTARVGYAGANPWVEILAMLETSEDPQVRALLPQIQSLLRGLLQLDITETRNYLRQREYLPAGKEPPTLEFQLRNADLGRLLALTNAEQDAGLRPLLLQLLELRLTVDALDTLPVTLTEVT